MLKMRRFSWRSVGEIVPRWSQLRAISNSGPAKLTILIALLGYFVIFNAKLVHDLDLIREIAGSTARPSSVQPRLLLIYFGLCAFAVGAALYSIFCPSQVKNYGSGVAYVRGDGPYIKDWAFEPIEDELRNSAYKNEYMRIRDRNQERISRDFPLSEAIEQAYNATLHLYFAYKDNSHLPVRLVIFICYIIGFICLIMPSLGVFVRVARLLWGTFTLSVLF
jgi:hypothetical protein